jgi:hypothetical protein
MRGSSTAFRLASAMAAMMSTGRGGNAVLDAMFAPRFSVPPPINPAYIASPGKHAQSGKSRRRYWGGNNAGHGKAHCGAKQAAKYARQVFHSVHRNFDERMAWNERNAHVLAKREADQERAAGPLGGRNAIIWGRR